jgi:3-hydroxyacyl-CoA dehydrogenase
MAIETIGVVGAGTMGNGIAQMAAIAGVKVVMVDVTDEALAKGMAAIAQAWTGLSQKRSSSVQRVMRRSRASKRRLTISDWLPSIW